MSRHLRSYLRSFRRHSGLSQADVAFLLGLNSTRSIYRHEWVRRDPALRLALAYGIVFDVCLPDLFAGVHDEVELAIIQRAYALYQRIELCEPTLSTQKRLAALRRIMERDGPTPKHEQ